jgi:hypothetical protein
VANEEPRVDNIKVDMIGCLPDVVSYCCLVLSGPRATPPYPSFVMSASFTNQVLARNFGRRATNMRPGVSSCPKHLDEGQRVFTLVGSA